MRDVAQGIYGGVMSSSPALSLGSVEWVPALEHTNLLGVPVARQLTEWAREFPELVAHVWVGAIDPDLSDTATMSQRYGIDLHASVNCVLVAGKREGVERHAAVGVRATTRADINGTVRTMLNVRKASFVPVERAVTESEMEYGGITPIGLPTQWRFVVDESVNLSDFVVIGSGIRASKIALPGHVLVELTGAQTITGLGA